VTALLQRLSARRVPLAEITPGPRARDGVIEFLDGTQLLFVTRRSGTTMKRFGQWHRASPRPRAAHPRAAVLHPPLVPAVVHLRRRHEASRGGG
jgi:hypothetical protein